VFLTLFNLLFSKIGIVLAGILTTIGFILRIRWLKRKTKIAENKVSKIEIELKEKEIEAEYHDTIRDIEKIKEKNNASELADIINKRWG